MAEIKMTKIENSEMDVNVKSGFVNMGGCEEVEIHIDNNIFITLCIRKQENHIDGIKPYFIQVRSMGNMVIEHDSNIPIANILCVNEKINY